jgi:hypothetical protein
MKSTLARRGKWWGNQKEGDQYEDGMIDIKWILEKNG